MITFYGSCTPIKQLRTLLTLKKRDIYKINFVIKLTVSFIISSS